MTRTTALIITFVLITMTGHAQRELWGTWQYQSYYGTSSIEFRQDNTIIVDGESANYTVQGNTIVVSNAYGSLSYPYTLNGNKLLLTFPDGLVYEYINSAKMVDNNIPPQAMAKNNQAAGSTAVKPTNATANKDLIGRWVCNSNQRNIVLNITSANSLVYDGEQLNYSIANGAFQINNGYGIASYPFNLQGKNLSITFPEGYSLTFNRATNAGNPGGGQAAAGGGNTSQLYGKLCHSASSSDSYSGYSRLETIYFDGNGRLQFYKESSFSSGSGIAYGGDQSPEPGSYTINGNTVVVTMDVGGTYNFRINMVQNSGRITELFYGQKLYATGLCE